jgi:hypothetical protein
MPSDLLQISEQTTALSLDEYHTLRRVFHSAGVDLPDDSLSGMTSNTFDFTVYVGPEFARPATDVPKAGLFQRWQVDRH